MSNIDALKDVPDINFVDTDINTLLNNLILAYQAAFEDATGDSKNLYPTDKERIWLYTAALKFYQLMMIMDLSAKQNLLKYAKGPYLENIGVTRISEVKDSAKKAIVSIKFVLSAVQNQNITIPANTRVTAGDNIFFSSEESCIIEAGLSEKIFTFSCTEAGIIGNNYVPGVINTLVDPVPYIQSVSNTEISIGGADVQSDDSYTQEVWEAPEGFAVAGPKEAYEYRAKQFSQAIEDVVAYSPEDKLSIEYTFTNASSIDVIESRDVDIAHSTISTANTNISNYVLTLSEGELELNFAKPVKRFKIAFPISGVVNIVPLLSGATIPTQTFLDELKIFLNGDKFRPLTDKVKPLAPTESNYSVDFKYWINSSDAINATSIQAAVDMAVEEYKIWQGGKLARDINPDELIFRVKNAGAKRLAITNPVYKKLTTTEIAKCTDKNVNYQGLEG